MASPGFGVRGARRLRRRRREHRSAKGAEWGGEGCPLPSRLGGLGERRELPQQGPGQSPGRIAFFVHILGHRTLLVAREIRFSCPKYKKKMVFFHENMHHCSSWYM